MREFAWVTAGWLNYVKMVWDRATAQPISRLNNAAESYALKSLCALTVYLN
jgi:hypothetical protein